MQWFGRRVLQNSLLLTGVACAAVENIWSLPCSPRLFDILYECSTPIVASVRSSFEAVDRPSN